MTIWEKAVLTIQKGAQKINVAAAAFAERVKAEIAIVRLRIRIDEVQTRIDELYRTIGRTMVDLTKKSQMPKATDELLGRDDITAAMSELADREKEIEELKNKIKNELDPFRPETKQAGDTTV